jgi:hypothetical protein
MKRSVEGLGGQPYVASKLLLRGNIIMRVIAVLGLAVCLIPSSEVFHNI